MTERGRDTAWVVPGLAQLFEIVLDAARDRRKLTIAERDVFYGTGFATAEQGGALSRVIGDYFKGAAQLWEQVLLSADPEHAVEVGRSLRRVSEGGVESLTAGFESAQRRSIRAEESLRRELIDDLLNGTTGPAGFVERAGPAGFPVASRYLVAVAEADIQLSDAGPIHAQVSAELSSRAPTRTLLTFTKGGRLVVVAPEADEDGLDLLEGALGSTGPIVWRAGVGEPAEQAEGIHVSYRQALEALRLGRVFGLGTFVHHREVLVFRLLSVDPDLARRVATSVLDPLVDAKGSLLETLDAFIAEGGNMAGVARRLNIGARTVSYRLGRITALTGHSPRDPGGRLTLEVALRCRSLVQADEAAVRHR